jgi:hypothetical protein
LIFLLIAPLFSSPLQTLYKYYERQEYEKGCNYGFKYYKKYLKNEKFLTLYGLSCLETDRIERIATPMVWLKGSASSRANGTYFSTILLQKELLIQALLDNRELGNLILPKTDFFLSKIFNLFIQKRYKFQNNIYKLKDGDIEYQLYRKRDYMIIDIYKDGKFTKRYRYS